MRLTFTTADWPLVRFAEAPAPVLETVLGIAELRNRRAGTGGRRWAEQARRSFPPAARPLLDVITAQGPWPEFLDYATPDMDEALEMIAATPKALLRTQLASSWRRSAPPAPWIQDLAVGDRDAMGLLVRGLRAFYLGCIAPRWPLIHGVFHGDLTGQLAVLAQGGLGQVFGSLHDELALRDGALERTSARSAGVPADLSLDGRGLLIVPSALWARPTAHRRLLAYARRRRAGLRRQARARQRI